MLVKEVVVHWGRVLEGKPEAKTIIGEVDWSWRYLLMRKHTAGHLFDHCLSIVTKKMVETTDSWLGDPCYVGYKGSQPSFEVLRKAEELENDMISMGLSVKAEIIPAEKLSLRAPGCS